MLKESAFGGRRSISGWSGFDYLKNNKQINKRDIVPDDLERLLTIITKGNLHGEFDTEPAVGKEFW